MVKQDHEQNALVGLAAEAGEVLDVGKKRWFHNVRKNGRLPDLKEEFGDVLYYLIKGMDIFDLSLDEVLAANKAKLFERHNIG